MHFKQVTALDVPEMTGKMKFEISLFSVEVWLQMLLFCRE